jgi:hypothetical protein
MAVIYGHVSPRFERVRQPIRHYNDKELHQRALFWRIAIPAGLLFWACVVYGIFSVT